MTTFKFQQRNDTAANWTSNNPTLLAGEMGYETDSGKFKFGDGTTAWTSLTYYTAASASFKYGFYELSVAQTTGLTTGSPVKFDTRRSGTLPVPSSYQITLTSGKAYKFTWSVSINGTTASYFEIYNNTASAVASTQYPSGTTYGGYSGCYITAVLGSNTTYSVVVNSAGNGGNIPVYNAWLLIEEYSGV